MRVGEMKRLNVAALYGALDLLRQHRGWSWRDLAKELDVSPSTFTRMLDGKKPDADGLVRMVLWTRLPLDRFAKES